MDSGNPREVRRDLRRRFRFRQIFIPFQASRHAKLLVSGNHSDDSGATANSRILGQSNFRGHNQRQFDCVAFGDLKIGVKENSAATQVLGKTVAFAIGSRYADSNRKLEVETL